MAERPLMLVVSDSQEPGLPPTISPPVSGLCSEADLTEVKPASILYEIKGGGGWVGWWYEIITATGLVYSIFSILYFIYSVRYLSFVVQYIKHICIY